MYGKSTDLTDWSKPITFSTHGLGEDIAASPKLNDFKTTSELPSMGSVSVSPRLTAMTSPEAPVDTHTISPAVIAEQYEEINQEEHPSAGTKTCQLYSQPSRSYLSRLSEVFIPLRSYDILSGLFFPLRSFVNTLSGVLFPLRAYINNFSGAFLTLNASRSSIWSQNPDQEQSSYLSPSRVGSTLQSLWSSVFGDFPSISYILPEDPDQDHSRQLKSSEVFEDFSSSSWFSSEE